MLAAIHKQPTDDSPGVVPISRAAKVRAGLIDLAGLSALHVAHEFIVTTRSTRKRYVRAEHPTARRAELAAIRSTRTPSRRRAHARADERALASHASRQARARELSAAAA